MDFLRSLPCWIWPLIAGIICGILGYLIGRISKGGDSTTIDYSAELDACKRKKATLEADLIACNSKLKVAKTAATVTAATPVAASSSSSMASSFAAGAVAGAGTTTNNNATASTGIIAVPFDAAAAKAAFGKKRVKADDLTIVEGIGPKISELFHNHNITTWAALASTSIEKCQEVLNSGGKRFEIHRPGSWPLQAEMAAKGKWSELKKWQDEHDYGKA